MISTEEPLFRSVHSALTFAFKHQNLSPSTPLQHLVVSSGEGGFPRRNSDVSLHGEFGSVVAGAILYHVCELMTGEKMTIIGRYSHKIKPRHTRRVKVVVTNHDGTKTSQWVSEKDDNFDITDQFKEACNILGNHHDIRLKIEDDALRSTLIARYFGVKQSMKSLAVNISMSDRWLRKLNRPIRETLQKLEERAIVMIAGKLEERGFC